MIRQLGNVYILDTPHTSYIFKVHPSGHLEHLYYGEKIQINNETESDILVEKSVCLSGNAVCYSPKYPALSLEDMRLEMSSHGKGDVREPFIEVTHADGSYTSDFLFEKAEIIHGKKPLETLPGSYEEKNQVDTLTVTLKDVQYNLILELNYYVFEEHDVISRAAKLINTSEMPISMERLMSMQLDFESTDWTLSTFHGAWAREMKRQDLPVSNCKIVNESYCGCSSNRSSKRLRSW